MIASEKKAYHALSSILEKHTGQVVLANRHWRIDIALQPLMRQHAIPDLQTLATLVEAGSEPGLARACVEAMLNNESSFFRDQPNFALLTGAILDQLREHRVAQKTLRIWSAACSTGQEPYSLAMSILDNADKWRGWTVQILATDVSTSALAQAHKGRYSQFEIQRGLPVVQMLRYFDQQGEEWVAKNSLRRMVTFTEHNMLNPAHHFGRFDLICCRNILMYLSEDKRAHILEGIAPLLADDGMLMLGAAETVTGQTHKFQASKKFRGFYEVAHAADHVVTTAH